jgi:RsmE family RNA methyltransferase
VNYLFLRKEESADYSTATVVGERARYITEFHHPVVGGEYSALLESVGSATAVCEQINKESIAFRLEQRVEQAPHYLPVTVIQGICRPQTMKKVLQCAAMFRLERILFLPTEQGEKSYRHSKLFQDERQLSELIKGAEQVGNAFLPTVNLVSSLREGVDEVPTNSARFIGEPAGRRRIVHSVMNTIKEVIPFPQDIALAIGPEAGWSDDELEFFHRSDFQRFSLGEDHLRVEVALTAILGQLLLWRDVAGSPLISE